MPHFFGTINLYSSLKQFANQFVTPRVAKCDTIYNINFQTSESDLDPFRNYSTYKFDIYIYALGTGDLGLGKDTPGWTSPNSSGVRLRSETMFVFFALLRGIVFFKNLVRHGPLVNHDDLGMN